MECNKEGTCGVFPCLGPSLFYTINEAEVRISQTYPVLRGTHTACLAEFHVSPGMR
jgi:hypothetical protein